MDSEFLFYTFISLALIVRGYLWVLAVRDKGVKHSGTFVTDMFIIMLVFWTSETVDLFNWPVQPYDFILVFIVLIIVGTRNTLSLIKKFQNTRSLKNSFDQLFIVGLCTAAMLIIWFGLF